MNNEIKNELEELNSKLADNSRIYKIPEGYFDEMQEAVLNNIEGQGKNKNKVINIRWMMSIAAALIIVVGAIFLMNTPSQEQSEISVEEVYQYLDENIESFDDMSITSAANDYDLFFDDVIFSEIDDLSDYLEDDLDDISEEDLEQIF